MTEAAPDLLEALKTMQSFVGVMFGTGPDAVIPEIVNAPIGVPIKIGDMMRSVSAVIAKAEHSSATPQES